MRSLETQAELYIVYCNVDNIQTIKMNVNKTAYMYTEYLEHTVSVSHTVTDLGWVEGITELLLKYTGAACTWKTCNQIVVVNSYICLKAVIYFKISILNR